MAPFEYRLPIMLKWHVLFMQVGTFPFDKQSCRLLILSLAFESRFMTMNGSTYQLGPSQMHGNGEWDVTGIETASSVSRDVEIFGFYIYVKRVPNYYVYVIALPCFILTMLSIIGMFWTPNHKEEQLVKLSIGLTSLVSMTLLLDMLSTAIPKTAAFPLLGIYVKTYYWDCSCSKIHVAEYDGCSSVGKQDDSSWCCSGDLCNSGILPDAEEKPKTQ
ncbi:unnamed protein product, partial [Mesorhabditis belari]|uniref:Neurotransmitter-gated ion-channel ligand-binding domain-containing protein n=1 Tax=Mesorhabditis belari TaxID=2138241 RepID=A0AAF3EI14_9BILA